MWNKLLAKNFYDEVCKGNYTNAHKLLLETKYPIRKNKYFSRAAKILQLEKQVDLVIFLRSRIDIFINPEEGRCNYCYTKHSTPETIFKLHAKINIDLELTYIRKHNIINENSIAVCQSLINNIDNDIYWIIYIPKNIRPYLTFRQTLLQKWLLKKGDFNLRIYNCLLDYSPDNSKEIQFILDDDHLMYNVNVFLYIFKKKLNITLSVNIWGIKYNAFSWSSYIGCQNLGILSKYFPQVETTYKYKFAALAIAFRFGGNIYKLAKGSPVILCIFLVLNKYYKKICDDVSPNKDISFAVYSFLRFNDDSDR